MNLSSQGTVIIGVDEAGRGPLVGCVVAAAVILPQKFSLTGLTDSKKLSAKARETLFIAIQEQAIDFGIAEASHLEIDTHNILRASLLAMARAVEQLTTPADEVWVDGNQLPPLDRKMKAIVDGDNLVPAISAASILAKVTRDRLMVELDAAYPEYGFAQHKGYPTPQHLKAIREYGLTPYHRKSFAPCRQVLFAES